MSLFSPQHQLQRRFRAQKLVVVDLRIACLCLAIIGCGKSTPEADYMARVGDQLLTMSEVEGLLENTSIFLDSADAVSQIVEQWVTNELLYREAISRGLKGDPEVERLLEDNERSVLINALVNRMAESDMGDGPGEDALRTYYEQNRDRLALREPFVRVRHLSFTSADSASSTRDLLLTLTDSEENDSTFQLLTNKYASDGPEMNAYYPQSQLFARIAGLTEAVNEVDAGGILPVFEHDGTFHVIQLMDRVPAGAVPSLDMISDQLRSRVGIQMRKQLFARQVQRLRTRALARDELEIRY